LVSNTTFMLITRILTHQVITKRAAYLIFGEYRPAPPKSWCGMSDPNLCPACPGYNILDLNSTEANGWPIQYIYQHVLETGNNCGESPVVYLVIPLLIDLVIYAVAFYLLGIVLINLYRHLKVHPTSISPHK